VRLHTLDGGARGALVTLVGAAALLELLGCIIRGLRRPITYPAHEKLLTDVLLPMHAPSAMMDDSTPLLSLVHRPLALSLVTFVEGRPEVCPFPISAVCVRRVMS
jgi:hypothetical protein